MKVIMKTAALAAAAILVTASAAWAVPQVSDVTMTQRTGSRIVDIDYTLSGEEAIITLSIETNGVAIPDSAVTWLYGDVCKVVQTGTCSIVWNAGEDWPDHAVTNAKARVTAWATNVPPQVMVIDISKGVLATKENSYPVFYYTSTGAVPRGVTADLYKTDRILMQRISPTDPIGFAMGDETKPSECVNVRLTQPFYAGVYEVTQRQWYNVMGTNPSWFTNPLGPVEKISYNDIRGTSTLGGAGWPQNNLVDTGSFIGNMRDKTGVSGFDLPTEAQWEYACRAGTTNYYNDGIDGSADSQLDVLGWYRENSDNITHTVGQKTPNGWGLYDMHGNVYEFCLDWHQATLESGDDPVGADFAVERVIRSGSFMYGSVYCRSANREAAGPSSKHETFGFRLVRTIAQ